MTTPAPVDISSERIEVSARGCEAMGWTDAAAQIRALRLQLTASGSLLRECRAYLHRVNNDEGWYDETGAGEALADAVDEFFAKEPK